MNRRSLLLGVLAGAIFAVALGQFSVDAPSTALALAVIPAFVAMTISRPGVVVAATLPAVYLTFRVGPRALDMSMADFALILGIVVAITGTTHYGRTLSGLLRVAAAYQVLMLVVIAAHPTDVAITEWMHRAGLMAGGMLVGAAIVRFDMVALALRLFMGMTVLFSLAAVSASLRTGFAPAYPLGIHKNAAGSLLAMAIALLATAPAGSGLPVRYRRQLYLLIGFGLLATRSRGAIVGLGAVLLIGVLMRRGSPRLRFIAVVIAGTALVFVWTSVQQERRSDIYGHGAISVRERQQDQAWEAYKTDTLRGAGIRYYDSQPRLAKEGRPSSTIYESLAESGIVGAIGLALVVIGPLLLLRRGRSPWAVVGLAVFAVKSVHGIFDNFWVAGPLTFPWLILGIVAALELEYEQKLAAADPESEERGPALTTAP